MMNYPKLQVKIVKMDHFWRFKDHNSRTKQEE